MIGWWCVRCEVFQLDSNPPDTKPPPQFSVMLGFLPRADLRSEIRSLQEMVPRRHHVSVGFCSKYAARTGSRSTSTMTSNKGFPTMTTPAPPTMITAEHHNPATMVHDDDSSLTTTTLQHFPPPSHNDEGSSQCGRLPVTTRWLTTDPFS
ncbi:hypothetical protein BDZ89DRAFT_516597 [Hymenopellis radicata]|nr:hypothetical protein BDZ89DRAFT_516597 [Hymenopellis radicata]